MIRPGRHERMRERAVLAEGRCAELTDQLDELRRQLTSIWESFQRVTAERDARPFGPSVTLSGFLPVFGPGCICTIDNRDGRVLDRETTCPVHGAS